MMTESEIRNWIDENVDYDIYVTADFHNRVYPDMEISQGTLVWVDDEEALELLMDYVVRDANIDSDGDLILGEGYDD